MSTEASAQRNGFLGSQSYESGVFVAGAQFNTGGGNVTIIGGREGDGQLPRRVSFSGEVEGESGSASRLREREGLCVLSRGESAWASHVCVKGGPRKGVRS